MADNNLNVQLSLMNVKLLERLMSQQPKGLKLRSINVCAAYRAALSLPYIDIKTELYYEVDATGSTLRYEQLRFHEETEHIPFLNMLVTVDHLRNGHAGVLKKHVHEDQLLFSMLLGVVHAYMTSLRKRVAKDYQKMVS